MFFFLLFELIHMYICFLKTFQCICNYFSRNNSRLLVYKYIEPKSYIDISSELKRNHIKISRYCAIAISIILWFQVRNLSLVIMCLRYCSKIRGGSNSIVVYIILCTSDFALNISFLGYCTTLARMYEPNDKIMWAWNLTF